MADDGNEQEPGRAPKRPPRVPTPELYEKWWVAYRDGHRAVKPLAAEMGCRVPKMRHAVRRGWPEAGFEALETRAAAWDREKGKRAALQSEVGHAVIAEVVAESWETSARRLLENMERASQALTALGQKIKEAAAAANFVRYREVPDLDDAGAQRRDKNGRPQTVLAPYVDGVAVANAMRSWVSASKDQVMVSRLLFGTLEPPPREPGELGALPPVTAEQLERLRAGEIPEELSEEQLASALLEAKRLTTVG